MPDLIDTIVAQATPAGRGAIAVVRVSGPEAGRVASGVVPGLSDDPEPRRVHLVTVGDPVTGEPIDRGLLTWFPGAASYTGEDLFEFSGHGGGFTVRRVIEACRAVGARLARPGEFTRRAYLNGKLDLVQAEAIADLIDGTSPRLHREALRQLDRHLSRRVSELREGLVQVEALLAHHIDFPEEDDPPVGVDRIEQAARGLRSALEALARTAPEGERLREGALVVLAGRPNTGKSSLYNALVGEERALVTEIAGTTRDALEADIAVEGYPVRLVDTAGLRSTDGVVERLGIEVARRFLEHADLVLYCNPEGTRLNVEERAWIDDLRAPVLRVATMADAGDVLRESDDGAVSVSVVTGEGLGVLKRAVADVIFGTLEATPDDAPVLTRRRQADAVLRAAGEIGAFEVALREGVPAEYAGAHLKSAASALEEVVGLVDTEDVLDRLFAQFCIGK
ncbi:MAG: tRNA uridine-5-carboxymethylaminomethyl(34) synthesis GTPase MnmE [Gemmatimonadetes bacterium]|nr:tRNA uridine-5-carboxymethylaminomethyl(34) synthesis GTPase MnmE [Gemmatimonadota bacterium]